MYVRDVLMWGALICGVGAIPVLLAVNAVDERAAMAPPPAARAMSNAPILPTPGAPPSWTAPVALASGGTPGVQEPARTGTLPPRTSPAPTLADGPGSLAPGPVQPPRAAASDSTGDSVPLPRPGEPRLPVTQSPETPPPAPTETASRSDAPSVDPAASATDQVPNGQEPSTNRRPPDPEPVQSASATDRLAPSEKSAPVAASTPEPDRPAQSGADSTSSEASSLPAPSSDPSPAPGLPPVRPPAEAQAQALPSDRFEFASQVVPPKPPEPPKRRTSSSKRRKAPPAALPAIPLEQQFEWIQQ